MPERYVAFLSYAHRYQPWVQVLQRNLEAGLGAAGRPGKVFLDEVDLASGSSWVGGLQVGLDHAEQLILVLTPEALASPRVADEWQSFLATRKDWREGRLHLVQLVETPLPPFLAQIRTVDFQEADEAKYRRAFQVLLAGLLGRAPRDLPALPDRLDIPAPPGLGLPAAIAPSLAAALEEAYRRKEELTLAGDDTREVEREILDLRRELRAGGRLQAGDILADRFRLDEPLGHGGFATVWKAYDRRDKGLVAVKILHGQHSADRTRLDRFFRGARKMAELHHPGIVRVQERRFDDGGYHFFVMEYVPGGDLRRAVLENRLAPERVLPLLAEVAAALDFAHRQGVVHRDVKPANVLLDAAGYPKLTDFDLVRAFDTTGGTTLGGGMGTFLYTAPEVMQDPQEAGVTADVYSLAMTAAFCLYGKELPVEVLRDVGKFLDRLPYPAAVRSVLEKAAAWEPEQRFGSVAELAQALEGTRTLAQDALSMAQRQRMWWLAVREKRVQAISPIDRLEQEIRSLPEQWEERRKVYERVPEQVGKSRQALQLLDQLRRRTRNGNDLFFLDQAVQVVGRRWPEQARAAAELRARLYDHMPAPSEELFRWIETPKDSRVSLWREIPAGKFWMGSPDGEGSSDERPRYEVTIARPFRCAAVPVTQAQYAAFDDRRSVRDSPLHPVAGVTWFEAVSFCRWLSAVFPWTRGARLPVEAEWEYACRAGTERRYWSGDEEKDLVRVGWYEANSDRRTHQVGEKPANPWGLYDVHGNVCEWTLSPWSGSYEGREKGVTHDPAAVEVDPAAAEAPSGGGRVGRGGGYWVGADWARAAYRFGGGPWFVYVDLGFRVVLPGLELLYGES